MSSSSYSDYPTEDYKLAAEGADESTSSRLEEMDKQSRERGERSAVIILSKLFNLRN